ncbi:YlxX protein [Halalkalibacter wakoensis JCM 9140]|uniref:YlxX protein n=2 Tax=Halalkalibacter wakoensis TaxID=127891 RepID=W4PWC3_9BACI|nr:YlxX protein [Halalkalibacter wakoensis JCM 9140]
MGEEVMKNVTWIFTIVCFIIGLMLAIQFQSTQEPVIRDTRDIRELRREMLTEQERRQQLNNEIEKAQTLLLQYERSMDNREEDVTLVLSQQIDQLRNDAGLEPTHGEGIVITIDSLYNDQFVGQARRSPSSEVLRYLVNELNIYGAEEIAVGTERIITTSAFRDVNEITYLNNRRLPPLPLQVHVLTNKSESLHNHMVVSASVEYLEIRGFSVTIDQVEEVEIPGYDQTRRVRYMEEVKEG